MNKAVETPACILHFALLQSSTLLLCVDKIIHRVESELFHFPHPIIATALSKRLFVLFLLLSRISKSKHYQNFD